MPETTLTSPNGCFRILTRPDFELEGSDVTHVELHDVRAGARLLVANLSRADLVPVEILSSRAALFVDPEGKHWWMQARPLTLQAVDDLAALRRRYAPWRIEQPGERWLPRAGIAMLTVGALCALSVIAQNGGGSSVLVATLGAVLVVAGLAIRMRVLDYTFDPAASELRERRGWTWDVQERRMPFAEIESIRVVEAYYRGAPAFSLVAQGPLLFALHPGSYERATMRALAQTCADMVGCPVVESGGRVTTEEPVAAPSQRVDVQARSVAPAPDGASVARDGAPPKTYHLGSDGPATQNLGALSTHCARCGGGARFTGMVLETQSAPRRLESLTWCARCEVEATYWREEVAALLEQYETACLPRDASAAWDALWAAMRAGTHEALVNERLLQGDVLPLLSPQDLAVRSSSRLAWAEAMIASDAWCPVPSRALRFAEVMAAAVYFGDANCLEPAIGCKAHLSPAQWAEALRMAELRCGSKVVADPNGVLGPVLGS